MSNMKKEFLNRLNQGDRIEYYIRKHNIKFDFDFQSIINFVTIVSFSALTFMGILIMNVEDKIPYLYSFKRILIIWLIGFVLLHFTSMIGMCFMVNRLDNEFLETIMLKEK